LAATKATDVFAPFGGFADDCPVENSLVRLLDIPGVGFEAKAALCRVMRPLARV
jgi:D(-)-tartrate dehydratase